MKRLILPLILAFPLSACFDPTEATVSAKNPGAGTVTVVGFPAQLRAGYQDSAEYRRAREACAAMVQGYQFGPKPIGYRQIDAETGEHEFTC